MSHMIFFNSFLDYYGVAMCLVVIALINEQLLYGILWSLGFCLLGSPVCCGYIIYRVATKSIVFSNLSDRSNE